MTTKQFFTGFKTGMKNFGENMSAIVNSILLSIVYFIGIGITAFFAKIKKKNFLDKEISLKRKSYWNDLNLTKKKIEEYYKQF